MTFELVEEMTKAEREFKELLSEAESDYSLQKARRAIEPLLEPTYLCGMMASACESSYSGEDWDIFFTPSHYSALSSLWESLYHCIIQIRFEEVGPRRVGKKRIDQIFDGYESMSQKSEEMCRVFDEVADEHNAKDDRAKIARAQEIIDHAYEFVQISYELFRNGETCYVPPPEKLKSEKERRGWVYIRPQDPDKLYELITASSGYPRDLLDVRPPEPEKKKKKLWPF